MVAVARVDFRRMRKKVALAVECLESLLAAIQQHR
jgi:hypothetical protein